MISRSRTKSKLRSSRGAGSASGQVVKIVYWKGDKFWLGHLQDYPDYWTQGETLEDLKDHLRSLYKDITGGEIPGMRVVEDLVIS